MSSIESSAVGLAVMVTAVLAGGCRKSSPPPAEQPRTVRVVPSTDPIPDTPPMDILLKGPTFTPYTVAPEVLNLDEVARSRDHEYPQALRERGVGGTARVFILLDDDGRMLKTVLDRSSGNDDLDAAALRVAASYRFSPAMRNGRKVAVWLSIPVRFGN